MAADGFVVHGACGGDNKGYKESELSSFSSRPHRSPVAWSKSRHSRMMRATCLLLLSVHAFSFVPSPSLVQRPSIRRGITSYSARATLTIRPPFSAPTWRKNTSCGQQAASRLRMGKIVTDQLTSMEGGGLCDGAVRRYWDGMNRRDVEFALDQFSDNIFFQDMMFPKPFEGKETLRSHFETCLSGFPDGLLFVIDEISLDAGDGKCGAYWHCETPEGKAFPFSRGLSFYKCDDQGKLIFAREIPEPSTKPGGAGLAMAKFGSFMMRFIPDSMTFPKI